jgi:hypothetical protein
MLFTYSLIFIKYCEGFYVVLIFSEKIVKLSTDIYLLNKTAYLRFKVNTRIFFSKISQMLQMQQNLLHNTL